MSSKNNPEENDSEEEEEESSEESSEEESDDGTTTTVASNIKGSATSKAATTVVTNNTSKKKKFSLYSTVRKAQKHSILTNLLKSRRLIAVETIQRYVRGFLWRRAEERRKAREARIAKERNIRHVRRRQMERDYWWDADIDTDDLHRYQIEDLLMRLGLATWGTREMLLVRFKRWILHRSIVADIGVQCAAVAVNRTLNGSGGVYSLDVPTPSRREAPLVQLRQFQGKGYLKLCASFASDSVYSIDGKGNVYLLRGTDHVEEIEKPVLPIAKKTPPVRGGQSDSLTNSIDFASGGWHLAGRWLSIMRAENVTQVVPGGHFSIAAAEGGDAFSWGLNPHGELGNSKPLKMDEAFAPAAISYIPPNEAVTRVSAGTYHCCAATKSGRIYLWGCNSSNELGLKNTFTEDLSDCFYSVPVLLDLDPPSSHPSDTPKTGTRGGKGGGGEHSAGGDGGFGVSSRPVQPLHHRRHVILVSCGANHSAAVDSHGRVITWGCYDGGRLGRKNYDWPSDSHPDDSAEEKARLATRRKVRPQGGAPPGEVDGLYDGSANEGKALACIDIACGAWHTLLVMVPKESSASSPPASAAPQAIQGGAVSGSSSRLASRVNTPIITNTSSDGQSGATNLVKTSGTPPTGSRPSSTNHGTPGSTPGGVGGRIAGVTTAGGAKSKSSKKRRKKDKIPLGVGEGKRCGEVWAFGSGVAGQLGIGNNHIAHTPQKVQGLESNIKSVRAGSYVSACADEDGQIWYWGSRGAGMFQPIPRKAELPTGQRAGGLQDFACTRDGVIFLTVGVASEYFEEMVAQKVAAFRAQRIADQAIFHAKVKARLEEKRLHSLAKGEAFLRGAMCRLWFAKRMVKYYISRKMIDEETGRKRRYYFNTRTGARMRKPPYFLKAFGMEPQKEEEVLAAKLLQAIVRGKQAFLLAKKRAADIYEECENPDDPDQPFWFNPRTQESTWTKPIWLQ